ncbi:DUF4244 domain-containing protein [Streptomyces triculaminicus]
MTTMTGTTMTGTAAMQATTAARTTAETPMTPSARASKAATWWSRCRDRVRGAGEDGMTTAEYAVGTLAACALAAVLYKVVTSGPVSAALQQLIVKALHATF